MNIFKGLPKSSIFILGTEATERFSYYGMRAILTLYMVNFLLLPEHEAQSYYHIFAAAVYLFPLLGAFIADRLLGRYYTIISFSLLYCLGHVVLSFFNTFYGLIVGLTLIAIGAGGIKPCVSAFLGDQFNKDQVDNKTKAYNFFYFSINFGSFFATLLVPYTKAIFGYEIAFLIPAALMFIAVIIFYLGKNSYNIVTPKAEESQFFKILFYAIKTRNHGDNFFAGAYDKYTSENVDGVKSVLNILKVYLVIIVFWAMFDQSGSSWVIQAKHMDLNFLGLTLQPEMLQAFNPIMVMLLIPFCVFYIYPKFKLNPIKRIGYGMFIAGISFILVGVLEEFIIRGYKISAMWQFFPYLILTLSEVFVSITGLEFAYTQAPRSMKSIIASFWLLTTFFGNLLTAFVSYINIFDGSWFFYFFGLLSILICVPYVWLTKNYKIRNF